MFLTTRSSSHFSRVLRFGRTDIAHVTEPSSGRAVYLVPEDPIYGLAAEALMEEAKVGARRAEIMGPSGWVKPRETVNKRFLHSTLRNVVLSNRHKQHRCEKLSETHPIKDTARKKLEKVQS